MFKSIKFFNTCIDDCFDKETSYPDVVVEVVVVDPSQNKDVVVVDNEKKNLKYYSHRMVLSKNQVLRQAFQSSNSSTVVELKSSVRSKIQIYSTVNRATISPSVASSFLSFYYTGKLECNRREDMTQLLLLSHMYFAPEIVLSLLHYLDCSLLQNFENFTQQDCINILSMPHVECHEPCQKTKIISVDKFIENLIHNSLLGDLGLSRQDSKTLLAQSVYKPFTFKQLDNIPDIGEKYGGGIWSEYYQSLKSKAIKYLIHNFAEMATSEIILKMDFTLFKEIIKDASHENKNTSGFLACILNWLNYDYNSRIIHSNQLLEILQHVALNHTPKLPLLPSNQLIPQQSDIPVASPQSVKKIPLHIGENSHKSTPKVHSNYILSVQNATPPQQQQHEEESPSPEVLINKKALATSYLGIDMEETNSTSTPSSPVILINTPQLGEIFTSSSNNTKEINDTSSNSSVSTPSPTTGGKVSRSKSAFVRTSDEQQKGTFGHLKRLGTPFQFKHTERVNKEKSPPKTIFEVEEESLSDWQEVGRVS